MNNTKSPFSEEGMFAGANAYTFKYAKSLRKKMTDAEMKLWLMLKQGIRGCKFRRQHPIASFIVDFYCHRAKLVVEVDGSVHDDAAVKANDLEREKILSSLGCLVIRFRNEEVHYDTAAVIKKIDDHVEQRIQNNIS